MSPAAVTNVPIDRPALTRAVFDHLLETVSDVLLGRGVAPPDGGWPGGQSRNGDWQSYAVLKAGTATTPASGHPERLGRERVSWQCNYLMTSHHAKESSVDELAQRYRAAAVLWHPEEPIDLGGVLWVMQQVELTQMGATERDDSTDPAHWRVTDAVSVRVSRLHAR